MKNIYLTLLVLSLLSCLLSCKSNINDSIGQEYEGGIIVGKLKDSIIIISKTDSLPQMPWPEAQKYCEELNENGFTDWRLPTSDEMSMIYFNLYLQQKNNNYKFYVGRFNNFWWTKTEENGTHLFFDFKRGFINNTILDWFPCNFIPVRATK